MNYDLDRMVRGEFEYESGTLSFSEPRLELTVGRNQSLTGSFTVIAPQDKETELYLYVSGVRMQIAPDHILIDPLKDSYHKEIRYVFDASGLAGGDVSKGNITVISNRGEYTVPFVVTVAREELNTSVGNVRNLFHFANLAKMDWLEARNVFYSPAFPSILTGSSESYLALYRGLAGTTSFSDTTNEHNMEEFLIAVNKKSKVEFSFEESSAEFTRVVEMLCQTIQINRSGWGYTHLEVVCEGEFLSTEKSVLGDNEFLGNIHALKYYINPSKLHEGSNSGRIILRNAYTEIAFPVTVVQSAESVKLQHLRSLQKNVFELVEIFIGFRSHKIGMEEWIHKSNARIDSILEYNPDSASGQMFRVQLLVTQGRYNEAKWLLDRVLDNHKRAITVLSDTEEAYYDYLTSLVERDEETVNRAALEVEQKLREHPDNWKICWLLLYLKDELTRNPEKRLRMVNEQILRGCNSPVMYIEAYNIYLNNSLLLTELDDNTVRVLLFAVKRGILKQEIIDQIVYLAGKGGKFDKRVIYILAGCYKLEPTDTVLSAIVSYLIAGGCTDAYAFSWYALGVERNLRVTSLYEHYMMSIDTDFDGEIPRLVLMYFSYHCDLPFERKALLYAYLTKHAEEYGDISRSAEEEIQQFLIGEIRKGHINHDLAYLYKMRLDMNLLDEETADAFVPLVFMNLVTVEKPFITTVVLLQDKFAKEYAYRLENGKAMFPIYTSEFRILLEDAEGNRYADTVPFKLEKLMLPGKPCKAIAPLVENNIGLNVYLCEESRNYVEITEGNVDRFRMLMNSPVISREYKSHVRRKLADYYYTKDLINPLDEFLKELHPEGMTFDERADFIRYMVGRGMYDKAYGWIETYGPESVEPKTLLHLTGRLINRSGYEYNAFLLRLAAYIFDEGKQDDNLLRYLVMHYHSGIREMKKVRKAAIIHRIDSTSLLENMLTQMLFSGSFTGDGAEIYSEYSRTENPDTKIRDAYLALNAYRYFVKDDLIDSILIRSMFNLIAGGYELCDPCKFAVLKYYDENRQERSPEMYPVLRGLIGYCQKKRYIFPFLMNYSEIFPNIIHGNEKTYIEYKTNPENKVYIHYLIEQDGEKRGEYRTEEMQKIYAGICLKGVILFFGESLQYYIAEIKDGEEQLVESGSVRCGETVSEETHTVFDQINDIAIGLALQDYNAAQECTDEYLRQKYLTRNLFHTL